MKQILLGGLLAACATLVAFSANATTFPRYVEDPGTVYYDGTASLLFDTGLGGSLFGTGPGSLQVAGAIAPDLSSPSLSVLDPAPSETFGSTTIIDYVLGFDIDTAGTDRLSILWDLRGPMGVGSTPFGLMTFTGDFGASNTAQLLSQATTTGLFVNGDLKITGATAVPLPASLLLLLAGMGALAVGGARRRS